MDIYRTPYIGSNLNLFCGVYLIPAVERFCAKRSSTANLSRVLAYGIIDLTMQMTQNTMHSDMKFGAIQRKSTMPMITRFPVYETG